MFYGSFKHWRNGQKYVMHYRLPIVSQKEDQKVLVEFFGISCSFLFSNVNLWNTNSHLTVWLNLCVRMYDRLISRKIWVGLVFLQFRIWNSLFYGLTLGPKALDSDSGSLGENVRISLRNWNLETLLWTFDRTLSTRFWRRQSWGQGGCANFT